MGKGAARSTDMAKTCNDPADMPVGTVIAVGTVMINKLPAAKQGDQIVGVDTHIIMIPTPGGPVPTPLPHPFSGIIDGGLSSSVKIMGMPAATVNSTASNMPPHIPQGGPFQKPPMNKAEIILGSMNVFIGNGGSGGGGGGGGDVKQAAVKVKAAKPTEGHFLDVQVEDKGGKPVTGSRYTLKGPDGKESEGYLTGSIEKKGVPEGDFEIFLAQIIKVKWSKAEAAVGDKVKMEVETMGIKSGTEVTLRIFIKDSNFADHLFETIKAKVDSDKIEHEWELKVDENLYNAQDYKEGADYSTPYYYFTVEIGWLKQRSGLIRYKDWIELELEDEEGKKIGGAGYKLFLPNGRIITGNLDKDGYARVDKIPPGKVRVEYDIRRTDS